jgi:putative peptidoglycan lipid II flippase
VGAEVSAISPPDDLTPEPAEPPEPRGEGSGTDVDSQRAILRNTAVMSVGTGLSRLTGFVRLAALTYALGVAQTRLADTYNVANTTPNIIYELALGGVLSSVFVPVFVDWMQDHGREAAWDVSHRVMTLTVVALSAIALVGIAAAPFIIHVYTASDVSPNANALAVYFLRWFMPQIVFYGIGAVATGLLNAHRRFAAPMFAPILNNLIASASFVTFALLPTPDPSSPASPSNITTAQRLVLSVGTTLGIAAMSVVLLPVLRRTGWRWRWNVRWRHPAVTRIAHLAKWTVVYVVANQIALLIVIRIAVGLGKGPYSAYLVAFVVFQLPHAIFAVSIFTAVLPGMSSRWADGDLAGYRSLLSQSIRANAAIIIPSAFGYIAIALPIVRLLFQHGETGASDARLIASALVPFAIALFPFSLFQLLLRAFYAMQDTRTPALINIGAALVSVLVNLALVYGAGLGVQGLALGYAAGYTFASVVSLALIRRRTHGLDGRRTLVTIAKVLVAGACTALAARLAATGVAASISAVGTAGRALQVLAAVAAGVLVFAIAALILRIEDVDTIRRATMARVRRG